MNIQKLLKTLKDANKKLPPNDHELIIYVVNDKDLEKSINIYGNGTKQYPFMITIRKDSLSKDKISYMKNIKIDKRYSRERGFYEKHYWLSPDEFCLELNANGTYVEGVVKELFKKLWKVKDFSKIDSIINPV